MEGSIWTEWNWCIGASVPKFTGMRVGLAKTLIKKGRIEEARHELQAVLDEKEP